MNGRRIATALSIAGGVLIVVAAIVLVSIGWGETSSTSVTSDGQVITETHRTASVIQDSPGLAAGWVVGALVVAIVLALLVRYGGGIGPVVVIGIAGLAVLASILSIGIFLAPGAGLMGASAVVTLSDRSEQRRRASLPPPPASPPLPPPSAPPAG